MTMSELPAISAEVAHSEAPGDLHSTDAGAVASHGVSTASELKRLPSTFGQFLDIITALKKHAKEDPSRPCLAWLDRHCNVAQAFSRGELWEHSGKVSQHLLKKGLKKGDRAMIVYPLGLDFVVAFLACLRIGVIVVSVYPPNPSKLRQDIAKFTGFVNDCGSKIALTTQKFRSLVMSTRLVHNWPAGLDWIATDQYDAFAGRVSDFEKTDVVLAASDLAFLQYTSGSTGEPKGVMISHGNLSHQLQIQTSLDPLPPEDRLGVNHAYVGWVPQYHDMGLLSMFMNIFLGWQSYHFSPIDFIRDPELWPRAIEKYKATFTNAPDFSFALTAQRLRASGRKYDCSSIVWISQGGEPCRLQSLRDASETFGIPLSCFRNSYGMAEHVLAASSEGTLVVDRQHPSAGHRQHSNERGIEICIVSISEDESGELIEVEDGQDGEICLSSPCVALGYWGKSELTQRTFQARIKGREGTFLRTGDVGYFKGDNLFLTSRHKDLIVINGKNFAPTDIEKTAELAFRHILRPGCSVAVQHGHSGIAVVCELRDAKGTTVATRKLGADVKKAIESEWDVMVDEVLLVSKGTVPKTTSGKVQRSKTARLIKEGKLSVVSGLQSSLPSLEKAATLRELLALAGVDDFNGTLAANGVDSIRLTQVINVAKSSLKIVLDYETVCSCSCEEIVTKYENQGHVQQEIVLKLPQAANPVSVTFSIRILRQSLTLLAVFFTVAVATLPCVAFVEHALDAESLLWLIRGRIGPASLLVVALWMLSYSILCIVWRWILKSNRYKDDTLWSGQFVKWMILERLFGVWEATTGRFFLDTPWLNLFYKLLGADVAITARLEVFLRDWDWVHVGPGAKVQGKLHSRVFAANQVHFGEIRVDSGATVGAGAVIEPDVHLGEESVVAPGSCVPGYSDLSQPGCVWEGVPVQNIGPTDANRRPDYAKPWFLVRLLWPVIQFLLISCCTTISHHLVYEVDASSDAWSFEAVKMILSYFIVFSLTAVCLLLMTLLLKWTFVSPWITDKLATLVMSLFLLPIQKTFLINWWHRAFGMSIGRGSIVFSTKLCNASQAHTVCIGQDTLVFNGRAAPSDTPNLWSWIGGDTANPWSASKSVVIGSGAALYVQTRIESGVTVPDRCEVASFARVKPGSTFQTDQILVGNPAFAMPKVREEMQSLTVSGSMIFLHCFLFITHMMYLATSLLVGLMLVFSSYNLFTFQNNVYLLTPLRVIFTVLWLFLAVGLEMIVLKWMLLGKCTAVSGEPLGIHCALKWHVDSLYMLFEQIWWPWFAGLFPSDFLLKCMGFTINPGRVFLNWPNLCMGDADLIVISDGVIVDYSAYIIAHNTTVGGETRHQTFLDKYAVLHPASALFIGSVGSNAHIYPRSKALTESHVSVDEAWIGCPARCATLEQPQKTETLTIDVVVESPATVLHSVADNYRASSSDTTNSSRSSN